MATSQYDRIMHGVSANSPLPPSVETAYYRKCIELKRRVNEIEENNDSLRVRKIRIERAILKMRLERAMLLEQIAEKMRSNPDDSDDSNSPPPTPRDRPLRSKRAHRKATPTPAPNPNAPGGIGVSSPVPPSTGAHLATGAPAETPDPLRAPMFQAYRPQSSLDTPNGTTTAGQSAQAGPSGFAAINNPAPEGGDPDDEDDANGHGDDADMMDEDDDDDGDR